MNTWPLRFRPLSNSLLFADEAGGWFTADQEFLDRYVRDAVSPEEGKFLLEHGHAFEEPGDIYHTSFLTRWLKRRVGRRATIDYVILVPTLRCNLACDYCQVSRADIGAKGYDWTEETVEKTLAFLSQLETTNIKVEFQGGEPLLRLDLLERVRTFCRRRFSLPQFVVCSNFQTVSEEAWGFFADEDTRLSTSFDGSWAFQTSRRTHDEKTTADFRRNVDRFVGRFGSARLSALPTIDLASPPDFPEMISAFQAMGLNSIFLRPINYQGFARRRDGTDLANVRWRKVYGDFVSTLIEHNSTSQSHVEEFYLSHVLKRVLAPGFDGNVDLRNPSPVARDYLVIDHDGTIYPTDEARMMARLGQIDLSIGDVWSGLDASAIATQNSSCSNDFDPDCIHCPYQPFCGTDNTDCISRYGRVDIPRAHTWFCNRHLVVFDKAFELLTSDDPKVRKSLQLWTGLDHVADLAVAMRS